MNYVREFEVFDLSTLRECKRCVGGLSNPSKMPGFGYGLPAKECPVGKILRRIEGSVCRTCYAFKGRYPFPNVQAAQYRRLATLRHPQWADAMVRLIQHYAGGGRAEPERFFRWHDSGDLQGLWHLELIAEVCCRTPNTEHWLPTREYGTMQAWDRTYGEFPANLVPRVSVAMVDANRPSSWADRGWVSSGVHRATLPYGRVCPAPDQDGECGDCRACWDRRVDHVSYHAH